MEIETLAYIVTPAQAVVSRIGRDVTFQVHVVAFLNFVADDIASER